MPTQDAVLLQTLLADGVPHALTDVIDELVKDREKGAELLDLPEVGGAELVQRDRLVVLVLVVEGVEAGGDGI